MALKSFNDVFKTSLYRDSEKFCDATIVAEDGTEFKVHKLVLSTKSEYFRTYFRGNIEKNNRLALSLSKDILEDILIFLYTEEVNLHAHNIGCIIIAADYLLIDSLLVECELFAFQEISLENCTPLLIASQVVERLGITEYCYRFVQVHFGSLVRNNNSDIEELPYSVLKNLLNDEDLGVIDESTVWRAIVIWVKRNDAERLKYVPELLTCIRWNSVNYRLASQIRGSVIFRENTSCKSIDLNKYALISKHEMLQSCIPNLSPGRCPSKMYLFMRRNTSPYSNNTSVIYLTYDGQIDIWRKVGETDENFHALFTYNRFIFMFNTISNEMKTFDLLKKTWVKKENMRSPRQSYSVVQIHNYIFVVGGYNFTAANTDVEYYNSEKDTWNFCMPMPPINVCGAAVINGIVYVIGYHEDPDRLELRALAYDIAYDHWSDIEKPKLFRTTFGIINYLEQLYIFGGRTEENNVTTSVEMYSPLKNEWKEFPALPFPYELPHAIIMQDKLIVFDDCPVGDMSTCRFSPCVWNDEIHAWDVETFFSPFIEIHKYSFCCIKDRELLLELSKENKDFETVWVKTPFATY